MYIPCILRYIAWDMSCVFVGKFVSLTQFSDSYFYSYYNFNYIILEVEEKKNFLFIAIWPYIPISILAAFWTLEM